MSAAARWALPARSAAVHALTGAQKDTAIRLLFRMRNAAPGANKWAMFEQEIGNDLVLAARLRDALNAQIRVSADACTDPAVSPAP